jgi:hypothetical protein
VRTCNPTTIALLLALAGCAPNFTVVDMSARPPSVATYYLEVTCEHCDHSSLERRINDIVAGLLPRASRAHDPEIADLTIRYSEGDSELCLDCDEEPFILQSWWWNACLYERPGAKDNPFACLFGYADKFRGRPTRFFRRQFAAYLSKNHWPESP